MKFYFKEMNTEINVPDGTEQKHHMKIAITKQQQFNFKL